MLPFSNLQLVLIQMVLHISNTITCFIFLDLENLLWHKLILPVMWKSPLTCKNRFSIKKAFTQSQAAVNDGNLWWHDNNSAQFARFRGGGTSYPTPLCLFIFPSVSGINRNLVLGEMPQSDLFVNWIALQRDFKWEESHMKENHKIKCSQDSWIYYDESHTACIWKARFLQ